MASEVREIRMADVLRAKVNIVPYYPSIAEWTVDWPQ